MTQSTLHLLRHFPTQAAQTCFGRHEVEAPFTPWDILRISRQISQPAQIWSSPQLRCAHLAQALAQHWQIPWTTDPRLQEIHFGEWEGQSWSQIPRQDIDQWAEDVWEFTPPKGESPRDVCKRVASFRQDLQNTQNLNALIITHAGVIRVWNLHPEGTIPQTSTLLCPIPHGVPLPCRL